MIKAISFESAEFSNEFVMNEMVSLIFILIRENKRMT